MCECVSGWGANGEGENQCSIVTKWGYVQGEKCGRPGSSDLILPSNSI